MSELTTVGKSSGKIAQFSSFVHLSETVFSMWVSGCVTSYDDFKYPMILPNRHDVVDLLIRYLDAQE